MVGLGGLEPPTSPLSGVRSSHLSYRPNRLAVNILRDSLLSSNRSSTSVSRPFGVKNQRTPTKSRRLTASILASALEWA
jgi:hypothetical protein